MATTGKLITTDSSKLELISKEEAALVSKEIINVREEIRDCPYLEEALKVLPVKGYRSAIGSYWNAVVDDIRQKIMHRSLDLFNKEINPKKKIERYEDFQDYIIDNDLIDGAYKIGVLSWEGRKLMHQARETRNMFHGHPKSSDPGLLKVLNLISDCNKYVLSQEYPPSIIDISTYLAQMDSPDFSRNEIAVDQAFTDLPSVYKTELSNRFYTTYISDSISSDLRGNIEFCAPILWSSLTKDDKKQIGKRFDKEVVNGDQKKIDKAFKFIKLVKGMMYVNSATRKVIVEPLINELYDSLDDWDKESNLVKKILPLSRFIPDDLMQKFVIAITRTYVGYKGSSYQWSRKDFYSNGAAPRIKKMFQSFDSIGIDLFVNVVKTDLILRRRIKEEGQLDRLRILGNILFENEIASPESERFLEELCDEEKTEEFFTKTLPKLKKS
ncbi:MAG: hypothetical protein HWD90_08900 [Campylobacteraceae bacterium]|nr:hypothetical protein [Campylobacteraceae bacterium]